MVALTGALLFHEHNVFFHFLPCFPWVDLQLDWETQLAFHAFPWQREAVMEGFAAVRQLCLVGRGWVSAGSLTWLGCGQDLTKSTGLASQDSCGHLCVAASF